MAVPTARLALITSLILLPILSSYELKTERKRSSELAKLQANVEAGNTQAMISLAEQYESGVISDPAQKSFINEFLTSIDSVHIWILILCAFVSLWFGYVLRVLTIVGETQLIEFSHEQLLKNQALCRTVNLSFIQTLQLQKLPRKLRVD